MVLQSVAVELDGLIEGWLRKLLYASFVRVEADVEAPNRQSLASPELESRGRDEGNLNTATKMAVLLESRNALERPTNRDVKT